MNWSKLVPSMRNELKLFVNRKLSGEALYSKAVTLGLGSEVRPMIRQGVDRGRKIAREALRRRNLL